MMPFVKVAKKACNGFANMLIIRSNGETKMTKNVNKIEQTQTGILVSAEELKNKV